MAQSVRPPAGNRGSKRPPAPTVTAGRTTSLASPTSTATGRVQLAPEQLEEFLLGTTLFKGVDPALVSRVARALDVVQAPPRASLAQAGSQADHLGMVLHGRLSVQLVNAATGATTVVENLAPGDFYGDVGALLGTVHAFTVVAEEPSIVARFAPQVFEQFMAKVPAFANSVGRRLAARVTSLAVAAMRVSSRGAAPQPDSTRPAGPTGVIPFVDLAEYPELPRLIPSLPARVITQLRLLPLRLDGNRLTVGMVAPRDQHAIAELRKVLHSVDFDVVAISLDDFSQAVVRNKIDSPRVDASRQGRDAISPESLAFDAADSEREAEKAVRVIGDEVVRMAARVVAAALSRDASDIHIESEATGVKVRFRINGTLVDWEEFIPAAFAKGLVARFKVLAGMDITQSRMPQDGRIGLTAGRREVDLRLSTLPASRGEKMVLRVADAAAMMRPLEQIFLMPETLSLVRNTINRPYGAIVIAGATGSGKTSTLYSALGERRRTRPDSNIITVEDPIEFRLPGVTQVQIQSSTGLGFAQVLRASLRQDPDVISIGEMRDRETAEMCLEAAMTGHLILTSTHANNAVSVFQRLETLGCTRTMVAQGIALILVQRLVRKLCPACTRLDPVAPMLLESLAARRIVDRNSPVPLPRPVGCDQCQQSGYQGRAAVIESLAMDEEVRNLLMADRPLGEVERAAATSGKLRPFASYASFLLNRRTISASEAILAISE